MARTAVKKEAIDIDWTKTSDSLFFGGVSFKCRIVCYPEWGPVRICDEALKEQLSESIDKKYLKLWDMVFAFVPLEVLDKSDEGIVNYVKENRKI